MAYATVSDMVTLFGAAEMIRASTPDGAPAVAVVAAPIELALANASALIDSYLRKRYLTPLAVAPTEINQACCKIARYELSTGGERNPSEQSIKARDDTVKWLMAIAKGDVTLDLQEVTPGVESFSQTQSRPQVYQDQYPVCDGFGNWPGSFNGGAGWP